MAYLTSEIGPPKGFHPVSSTTIHLPSPYTQFNQCSLYIYHTLPLLLFVDTHELAQWNGSYTFEHWGSRDLEKPVYALPDEISELLVNVRLPEASQLGGSEDVSVDGQEKGGREIHVEVPMHLRYGTPKTPSASGSGSGSGSDNEVAQGLYERIRVDWPQGFLRCPLSSSLKEAKPETSLSLPAHILSTLPSPPNNNHILIPIPPHSNFSSSETFTDLYLPLGNTQDLAFVEPLTALTILGCCFWVFRMALKTLTRLNNQGEGARRPKTS